MRIRNVLLAVVVISSVLLASCGTSSAIDVYMTKDIESIGVEKNMEEAGTKLETILGECIEKAGDGEEVDWDEVGRSVAPVLESMQETRDKIAQIKITDESVKEINSYLISTYDKLISGYKKLIEGLKTMDDTLITEGSEELTGAQEDVQKWYDLIEKSYK